MKILLLSHRFYPNIGGIEVNSEILATSLSSSKHEVHVVTWSEDAGSTIFPFVVVRKPNVVALMSEHAWADVILENNPCLRLSWPAILFRKRPVVVLNTWLSRMDGTLAFRDVLKILWLKRASKVIAVSSALKDGYFKPAIVIGNPYRADRLRILQNIQRDKDFVFLGRLVSDKGADLAIKAFEEVLRSSVDENKLPKNYSLTIIGDGPFMPELKQLAGQLGVNENITFTGALSGELLLNALNEHKYIIVSSLFKEPFGNVALEGIACGCVPIVSNGGGLPDAVGDAGLVFSQGNKDSLVDSMLKLLNNPELVSELRHKGPDHLKNHHPDVVCAKYLSVIMNAANKSTKRPKFNFKSLLEN